MKRSSWGGGAPSPAHRPIKVSRGGRSIKSKLLKDKNDNCVKSPRKSALTAGLASESSKETKGARRSRRSSSSCNKTLKDSDLNELSQLNDFKRGERKRKRGSIDKNLIKTPNDNNENGLSFEKISSDAEKSSNLGLSKKRSNRASSLKIARSSKVESYPASELTTPRIKRPKRNSDLPVTNFNSPLSPRLFSCQHPSCAFDSTNESDLLRHVKFHVCLPRVLLRRHIGSDEVKKAKKSVVDSLAFVMDDLFVDGDADDGAFDIESCVATVELTEEERREMESRRAGKVGAHSTLTAATAHHLRFQPLVQLKKINSAPYSTDRDMNHRRLAAVNYKNVVIKLYKLPEDFLSSQSTRKSSPRMSRRSSFNGGKKI